MFNDVLSLIRLFFGLGKFQKLHLATLSITDSDISFQDKKQRLVTTCFGVFINSEFRNSVAIFSIAFCVIQLNFK